MTIFDKDFESTGVTVPRSQAGIAMMVRRLGVMESSYARLIWSRALADAIEEMDGERGSVISLEDLAVKGHAPRHLPAGRYRDERLIRAFQIHMNLRSPSATRLLFWLMANPGVFHSTEDLRATLGFAESSIKVFASELRKAFRNKAMPDPLISRYRKGYCVSAECAALTHDLISKLALEEGAALLPPPGAACAMPASDAY
ncbi:MULTISPECIES: helix-turn-helix domain-containing protein [unclassified Sphingobium]|uniref:helix-turn-helix domain-containing protein n=1 Tax=unclassified Sphingobium TaxID=2611147 RepID=UPI002225A9CE|nr:MULTISPECIES: helix-turn-helix domain-containing protein [unclassified Sphingobium]MCW2412723.1 hypothetical protein [Sphingobium sp. B8D3D]MCW2414979.1 hypothetical protein [Sphingobium sp. B8D3A]